MRFKVYCVPSWLKNAAIIAWIEGRYSERRRALIGIFGANGFIGRHLLARLKQEGIHARAFSRRFDHDFLHTDLVEGDFMHPLARASALEGVTTVVQLISTSSPGLRNDYAVSDIQENVIPHVEFLEDCIRARVSRFIFLSSGGTIYGPGSKLPTDEAQRTNPISSHGLTKLTIENYIKMYSYVDSLEYTILRVSNPFGPGQLFKKGQGLIPAILDKVRKDLAVQIYGDGEASRDYIYIDDLVEAIYKSIYSNKAANSILNIGSGASRSVNQVLNAVEEAIGRRIHREYVPARSTDVDMALLDITKANTVLKWMPSVPFEEGILRTVTSSTL